MTAHLPQHIFGICNFIIVLNFHWFEFLCKINNDAKKETFY